MALVPPQVPVIGPSVCRRPLQVGSECCRASEVFHMDEGTRGGQGLVRGPAWAQNHGNSSCLESVPPELLADVIFGLRVLKGQVKIALCDCGQELLLGQGPLVPVAVHIDGNVLFQSLVQLGPGLVGQVFTDHPAD